MPTYTYQCDECGHGFDAFQKFADEPLTECSECHGAIHRVIQPTPIVFKGSGWYITDSKSKNVAAAKTSEAASESNGKSGNGKSDAGEKKTAEPTKAAASAADKPAEKPAAKVSAD
ncbi:MAG: hypothetical protein IT337_08365 [Thermomicrobiales bacterium]|nr:hypothetical protein [Thermomicrobiales bacterium]